MYFSLYIVLTAPANEKNVLTQLISDIWERVLTGQEKKKKKPQWLAKVFRRYWENEYPLSPHVVIINHKSQSDIAF